MTKKDRQLKVCKIAEDVRISNERTFHILTMESGMKSFLEDWYRA